MLSKSRMVLLALAAFYIAVRLWHLTDSCLWFDEIFSVHAAEHPWNSLFWFVAQDLIHPPLFYATLKFWIGIGGESVLWLRLLPVLFSALAIVPFVYLCRELKLSTAVMMLGLGILSVNGSLIKYTQTVRMYSMLMFLALLSTWLFARYFNRGKSFVPLVIVNLLLIYTHYFGWLVVGSEVLVILIFQTIKWRRMAAMSGILIAAFVPWILAIWNAAKAGSDVGQNISWMTRPRLREMLTFLFDLTEPFYFQASSNEPSSFYWISVPILLILFTALGVSLFVKREGDDKRTIYFLAIFVFFPAVLAFVASWLLPYSVWGTRHLIIIYAPAAILLAHLILSIPARAARMAVIVVLFLLSGYAFYLHAVRDKPRYVWCAWNDVAADIRKQENPTKIYVFENLNAYHLWFALRDSDRHTVSLVRGLDVPPEDESYFLPRGFDGVASVQVEDITDDDMWLAFRTSAPGQEGVLFQTFSKAGYRICAPETLKYDWNTVFWTEMKKGSGGCER